MSDAQPLSWGRRCLMRTTEHAVRGTGHEPDDRGSAEQPLDSSERAPS